MTPRLDVRPDAYYTTAQDLLHRICEPTNNAFHRAIEALGADGEMAGGDPGGTAWADQYDPAVRATVRAGQDLANGMYRAVGLLEQTGVNHELAEDASHAGGLRLQTMQGRRLHDPSFAYRFPSPPAASGGSSDAPTGWALIEHWVGYVWPDGHQDRLNQAADAWSTCAMSLDSTADFVLDVSIDLVGQRSPEVDDALTTLNSFTTHLRDLAQACRQLSRACLELAEHIDTMRSRVEHELLGLAGQTLLIEGAGAVVSFFSVGAAEAPTQAVELSRVKAVADTVRGVIETFLDLARDLAESIPSISHVVERVAAAVSRLRSLRIRVVEVVGTPGMRAVVVTRDERITSTAMTVEERAEAGLGRAAGELPMASSRLPPFRRSMAQLEAKFKHAEEFGVTESRGASGFSSFHAKLDAFLSDSRTVRISGTYRGDPAEISYNPESALVVIQHPDGALWSCWRMTSKQLGAVTTRGSLGYG